MGMLEIVNPLAFELEGFEYNIIPQLHTDIETLCEYWQAMEAADTLKYRWAAMEEPTWRKAIGALNEKVSLMFSILDWQDEMVAEFALENFTGKAAQIHFSMRPSNDTKTNLLLANTVIGLILERWKSAVDPSKPYLETIYGLTPVLNRVACLFVLRSGMKKVGILPNGVDYLGEVCDALVTIRTRT